MPFSFFHFHLLLIINIYLISVFFILNTTSKENEYIWGIWFVGHITSTSFEKLSIKQWWTSLLNFLRLVRYGTKVTITLIDFWKLYYILFTLILWYNLSSLFYNIDFPFQLVTKSLIIFYFQIHLCLTLKLILV